MTKFPSIKYENNENNSLHLEATKWIFVLLFLNALIKFVKYE